MIVKPYVYRCEHKLTQKFYIGSRWANTVPASQDLGIHYFTSSKLVSAKFKEFNYEILAEYNTPKEALMVEQNLIWNLWTDPKILNRSCKTGGYAARFGQPFQTKVERANNYPKGTIKCPIRPGVIIDPADLQDIEYIRERIAKTGSKKNLKKWCCMLSDLLTQQKVK